MMSSVAELFSGIAIGVMGSQLWEFITRGRLYLVSRKLEGVWTAHEMLDGRTVDRDHIMQQSWPTVMNKKRNPFSADSHILDIRAQDTSTATGVRPHSGYLVVDRVAPWRATRVVFYHDSDEVFEQHILISRDKRTLYVIAHAPSTGYNRHALCKTPES